MKTDGEYSELNQFVSVMKNDWNERALKNAKWFINTVSQEQTDEEFYATGQAELEKWWLPDFRETLRGCDLKSLKVLEIGCGTGRMTCHLAEVFGEIQAVDVSGEMVKKGRARFAHLRNVRWQEVSGVRLDGVPDNYFDLGFSIYVYQHVPQKEIIRASLVDAYRKIRPGGFLKFHTNGLVNEEYEKIVKDTWTGETFAETDIRQLALETGARLVSLSGSGTQYCWTTFRKPSATGVDSISSDERPAIELYGLAADLSQSLIPVSGEKAVAGLVVSGLDQEKADCNSIEVLIGDRKAFPSYVGNIRRKDEELVRRNLAVPLTGLTFIEAPVPEDLKAGLTDLSVRLSENAASPVVRLSLTDGNDRRPRIVTVRNGADFGTDVYARGPKSVLNLYVQDLSESASLDNVRIQFDDLIVSPDFVGFVAQNGTWQVNVQVPQGVNPGTVSLKLQQGELLSEIVTVDLI